MSALFTDVHPVGLAEVVAGGLAPWALHGAYLRFCCNHNVIISLTLYLVKSPLARPGAQPSVSRASGSASNRFLAHSAQCRSRISWATSGDISGIGGAGDLPFWLSWVMGFSHRSSLSTVAKDCSYRIKARSRAAISASMRANAFPASCRRARICASKSKRLLGGLRCSNVLTSPPGPQRCPWSPA